MERQSPEAEDRISQLPREILVRILSFLTMKEVARTSVLSKDWIDLWMCVARLDFDAFEVLEKLSSMSGHQREIALKTETCKYVEWVNKVLQSHNVTALDELRICFELNRSSTNDIGKWLNYAFSRKVQKLELDLFSDGHTLYSNPRPYIFPRGLNGFESLVWSGDALNAFEFLRSLRLSGVVVAGSFLKMLLHKCHFLEHLAVNDSICLMSVEVCGSSLALRHLEICECIPLMSIMSIIVCDTNLVSLKICVFDVPNLVVKNVPMLVDVWVHGMVIKDFVSMFSCCLENLEVLTLYVSDGEIAKEANDVVQVPQLTKLKQLILMTSTHEGSSLIPYTSLIRASPNVEKFVLKLRPPNNGGIKLEIEKAASSLPIPQLKVFEIRGYYGGTMEDELVKYILENAVSLGRIIIDARPQPILGKFLRKQPELENVARSNAKELVERLMLTSPSFDVVLL